MFVLLVLLHLRFFHSVSCGWLPFWGSPAGCSFTCGRPYRKRSSSSSRTGGRKRFRGVREGGGGLLLPGLRVSGGGGRLLYGPFPEVVCPSIGRPGGTRVRSLGL